jgi:hypothetical protein
VPSRSLITLLSFPLIGLSLISYKLNLLEIVDVSNIQQWVIQYSPSPLPPSQLNLLQCGIHDGHGVNVFRCGCFVRNRMPVSLRGGGGELGNLKP